MINLEINRNNNYYVLLVITWDGLMTFPRYGVDRDFNFLIENERSLRGTFERFEDPFLNLPSK